ncbi:quaternary ammonium transporter [Legionella antarctica]|uniref:Quaternary ammonium transporter n=1 Tax=Legionella antarctica TaxID=2708020 RepID=A0A6F8T563_9GAMM|nr:glycine betaine ABC transporter substrate-binding protein [Legionella antarctica]BCA95297.1 quaternary ammonium transporter [Legionella antarctica]
MDFIIEHLPQLQTKLVEHINISLTAMFFAIILGISLGILITRLPKLKNPVLGLTNIFQTIPSIALLGFLIPLVGIGLTPTLIALIVYALLPITSNTYIGLKGIAPTYNQVANSLGFTRWQRLHLIELPLALPVIMGGVRISMAMTISITTIAAFIGAGGLGDFITQGLSLNDQNLILLGAIPTALLALTMDYSIVILTSLLSQRHRLILRFKKTKVLIVSLVVVMLLTIVSYDFVVFFSKDKRDTHLVIGSKNFTEQYVLGYLMADLIEAKTHLHVDKKFNLGTTAILQNALLSGQVDLYPEYTGTAYLVVLKQKKIKNPQKTYQFVQDAYLNQFQLVWLSPFGFYNAESLAVKEQFAEQNNLINLSDLVQMGSQITLAAPAEFLSRPDGLPGLTHVYGFKFKKIVQMQPDLVYHAIQNDKVQAIGAFTTDGRITEFNLRLLTDNKHFYPPYYAAPVIRNSVLKKYPQIAVVLKPLLGTIDNETMQHLNYLVDVKKISPQKVAHDFLVERRLI